KSKTDEELLSLLFEESQAVEYGDTYLRDTVMELLVAVSKPFTDFVEQWIGVSPETGTRITKEGVGKAFVKVENQAWVDDMGFELEECDYALDNEHMPSFIPAELAQSLFETGRNLRFLWENEPDHPLSNSYLLPPSHRPTLQWQFDWK